MNALAPTTLADRIERGEPTTVLDIRNRDAVDAWHIDGPGIDHVHVPSMQFTAARARGEPTAPLPEGLDAPIVVVCARGEASDEVAAALREAGLDAQNLAGGMDAWARVYRATELAVDGAATVVQYRRPATGCLAYLVRADGEALVVDPLRAFADRYASDAADRNATLTAAVDTHVHADHLSGLRTVSSGRVTAYMSPGSLARGVTGEVTALDPGTTLAVGGTDIEVIATPGHTSGGIALVVGDVLLCGDTLFVDGVARPDLEANDETRAYAAELYRTLTERLGDFDDGTVVAPGHYRPETPRAGDGSYTARLGDLREQVWAFDVDQATFVERVVDGLGARPANDERIIAVNLGAESADDETAFELELGPNNCAVEA